MSSSPLARARPMTPTPNAASIISGKIETMSNFTKASSCPPCPASPVPVHFQQPLRRRHNDALCGDVDVTDFRRERDQYFAPPASNHEPRRIAVSFDGGHAADDLPAAGRHVTTDELVVIVGAFR